MPSVSLNTQAGEFLIRGFVLIRTTIAESKATAEKIRQLGYAASAVTGAWDVLVVIDAASSHELGIAIIDHIQALPAVQQTMTLVELESFPPLRD